MTESAQESGGKSSGGKPKHVGLPRGRQPDLWYLAGSWLAKHGALPVLGAITVAVLVLHWHVFAGETVGDDLSFHIGESARLADCIRNLDFDWWNPSANGGYASAYYYQVIPQLASAVPAAIFGHHIFWFQISVLLPLVLAPAAAYRGMRLMGATPWQSTVAAFCVAFMNGESRWGAGNAGTFNVGLYTQTWALSAFPLALGHGARWISGAVEIPAANGQPVGMLARRGLPSAIAWGGFVFLCHPFAGISLGFSLVLGFFVQIVMTWRLWESPTMLGILGCYAGGIPLVALLLLAAIPNAPIPGNASALAIGGAIVLAIGGVLVGKFRANDRAWRDPEVQKAAGELHRLAILGGALVVTTGAILLPLTIDSAGFGGFPHRVNDEIGPGFGGLADWYIHGKIFDFKGPGVNTRIAILTFAVPVMLIAAVALRLKFTRWLWVPGMVFALMLGLGPHIGKIGNDIFPPVRFLGAMQTVMAMATGAGVVALGQWLWNAPWDNWLTGRAPKLRPGEVSSTTSNVRGLIVGLGVLLAAMVAVPGGKALRNKITAIEDPRTDQAGHTFPSTAPELHEISEMLAKLPEGRKQGGPGAENHWWNLLTYEWARTPAVLQMGGGGLQASPNYDFLWTVRDLTKDAWIYDAPYLVFATQAAPKMPAGDTIGRTEHYELRKVPSPGLVSPAQVVATLPPWYQPGEPGHVWALNWAKSDMPIHDQIMAYAGSGGTTGKPAGHTIKSWRQNSPGDDADIVALVDNTGPTTYWVHESWHPRWHAYVDGAEVAVRRVTPDFMAVDTPAGKHAIDLRFERPLWVWLAWLLWPAPALIAAMASRRRGGFHLPLARLLRRRAAASAPPA